MPEITILANTRVTEVRVIYNDVIGGMKFSPAGVELIEAFMEYLKSQRSFVTSRLACGEAILLIGTSSEKLSMRLHGRNLKKDGMPQAIEVTNEEIQTAVSPFMAQWVQMITGQVRAELSLRKPLESPKIFLDGEFKALNGFAEQLTEAIGISVVIAP